MNRRQGGLAIMVCAFVWMVGQFALLLGNPLSVAEIPLAGFLYGTVVMLFGQAMYATAKEGPI